MVAANRYNVFSMASPFRAGSPNGFLFSVDVSRKCCVKAKELMDSDEVAGFVPQFEWYRECKCCNLYPSQSLNKALRRVFVILVAI